MDCSIVDVVNSEVVEVAMSDGPSSPKIIRFYKYKRWYISLLPRPLKSQCLLHLINKFGEKF